MTTISAKSDVMTLINVLNRQTKDGSLNF